MSPVFRSLTWWSVYLSTGKSSPSFLKFFSFYEIHVLLCFACADVYSRRKLISVALHGNNICRSKIRENSAFTDLVSSAQKLLNNLIKHKLMAKKGDFPFKSI
jgi:hypothetical protein